MRLARSRAIGFQPGGFFSASLRIRSNGSSAFSSASSAAKCEYRATHLRRGQQKPLRSLASRLGPIPAQPIDEPPALPLSAKLLVVGPSRIGAGAHIMRHQPPVIHNPLADARDHWPRMCEVGHQRDKATSRHLGGNVGLGKSSRANPDFGSCRASATIWPDIESAATVADANRATGPPR